MCHPCLQYLAFACLSILTVILQAHPPFNSGSGQTLPCLRVLPIGHPPPQHSSSRSQRELHLFRKARPVYLSRHSYSVLLVPFTFFTALSQLKCIYQSLLLASFLCVPGPSIVLYVTRGQGGSWVCLPPYTWHKCPTENRWSGNTGLNNKEPHCTLYSRKTRACLVFTFEYREMVLSCTESSIFLTSSELTCRFMWEAYLLSCLTK